MYEKKLKKALFELIRRYGEAEEELSGVDKILIEKKEGLDEEDYDALRMEQQCLLSSMFDFQSEIAPLLIETKFFPLVGLNRNEIKGMALFSRLLKSSDDENIDQFLSSKLDQHRDDIKKRLKKIKYQHLPGAVNDRIHYLYRQMIHSYVYGNYESSCILARAIADGIGIRFVKARGFAHLLSGKDFTNKKMTLRGVLKVHLNVSVKVLDLHRLIASKADRILHELDEIVSEKDALESIKNLDRFVRLFPKSL